MDDDETYDESVTVEQADMLDKTGVFEIDKISNRERDILDACRWKKLDRLMEIAESPGGFVTDELRRSAWPLLLGLPTNAEATSPTDSASWKDLPPHEEEYQVKLDVDRSFVNYPKHRNEAERNQQKQELSDLIVEVLRRYPYLHYFQGYHDICQVLLLVLPRPLRAPAASRLSALRIRDFMLPTLSAATTQLRLIPDILHASDPALWRHLSTVQPFFALSGTLTMYAHDITTLGEITRLFDVLLAREPVFSVYMFAAIVRSRRQELFDTPEDEPEILHSILSKLPKPLDLEAIIHSARQLFDSYPPETLPSWKNISRASVLKTARDVDACRRQTMHDGEEFFKRHSREIKLFEMRDMVRDRLWHYKRPAGAVGLAVLFGIVAYLLRARPASILGGDSSQGGLVAYLSALAARWTR
ncbi:GTPase-activating protein gyp10 [Rhypophila decipiens]|uniref:GTPase-activating protein gyp10 n=1 Tax=Rhypophila decipiens TaxID=261697 RepID=A0AAN7B883_9PEZI|nr:GTPase-activating protein gyp10 [Rhypophila decipiens]